MGSNKRVIKIFSGAIALIAIGVLFQNCSDQRFSQLASSTSGADTPEGTFDLDNLELTPSGCTDSATPVCDGGPDFVRKAWSHSAPIDSGPYIFTGANDKNGAINTNRVVASDPKALAVRFCADMSYGGFDDWYLPSKEELRGMFDRRQDFGNIPPDGYWSSTETTRDTALLQSLVPSNDNPNVPYIVANFYKATTMLVRCIRKK